MMDCDDHFEPTAELRFARPPTTTAEPDRLQQQWRKPKCNGWGHIIGWTTEWRDVPVVLVAPLVALIVEDSPLTTDQKEG